MEWLIERGAFVLLLSAMCSAPIGAQEITPVESIRVDPSAHVNEIRTVEGVVDRLVNRGAGLTPSYYLEDDTGAVELDMSGARCHSGLICEGAVVLAEGRTC